VVCFRQQKAARLGVSEGALTWWILPSPTLAVEANRLLRGNRRDAGLMARRVAAAAKDGRAALAKEEMPLPRKRCQLNRPQLARTARGGRKKVARGAETHLLNILPDDRERSEMGVERGWLRQGRICRVSSFARERTTSSVRAFSPVT